MMSQIYQNAAINISADHGSDSRAGCFVERNALDITPLEISSPQLSQSWKLLPEAHHFFDWMQEAPSFSRAWIHRERQLARRVLHFTAKELVWECCGTEGTSFASEMLPGGAPFENHLFNSDHKYQTGRLQQGLAEGAEETYATWNDICENLSDKFLTQPLDMPIVLSGLAKDFAHVLPGDDYVVGLWRSTLPQSLLWNTRDFKSEEMEYIAPSWSWLSTGCPVKLANRSRIERKQPVVSIQELSTELKYQDTYGPVTAGTVSVEGVLRLIQLTFQEESDIFELSVLDDGDNNNEMRIIGPSWDEYYGDMCTLGIDAPFREPISECFCLFITIDQWGDRASRGSRRRIACLLLQRSSEGDSVYARIGTLVLEDLYALKLRYRSMHTDAEEDFWVKLQSRTKDIQDSIIEADKKREEVGSDDCEEGVSKYQHDAIYASSSGIREVMQGLDALYQFDNEVSDTGRLKKLDLQIIDLV